MQSSKYGVGERNPQLMVAYPWTPAKCQWFRFRTRPQSGREKFSFKHLKRPGAFHDAGGIRLSLSQNLERKNPILFVLVWKIAISRLNPSIFGPPHTSSQEQQVCGSKISSRSTYSEIFLMTGSAMLSWSSTLSRTYLPGIGNIFSCDFCGGNYDQPQKIAGVCDFGWATGYLIFDKHVACRGQNGPSVNMYQLIFSALVQCDGPGLVKLKEIVQKFLGIAQRSLLRSLELRRRKDQLGSVCPTDRYSMHTVSLNQQKSFAKGKPALWSFAPFMLITYFGASQ